ncbi:DNA methyltransferase [Silanimonas sp.]|jgi:adenine-specific DNA-methyltransferase|uniref:type II toxin-antitoxin system antitoxin DNA ADP-ribosyl glycohydrolase DarG n=1 Tax=Silanimonas sp. TaxID=1929290 RepID=UPI0037CC5ACF
MITPAAGNLLTNDAEALVNTVNLDGVMGKGIALQFAKAFPEILPLYEAACRNGELAPGRVQVIERPGLVNPRYIINVPTKRHWRGKSRMADIDAGLADLVRVVRQRGIRSIAVPPLGCGLGGLAWADVRPRIERAFAALPEVEVRLFAPVGAPAPADQPNRTSAPALTAARARVIQVLGAYLDLGYELSLLEVQKLLYFLQGAGDDLKLAYGKNRYGPYADNLRHVLKRFEGHYTHGYGDGNDAPDTEITLLPEARQKAQAYLASQAGDGEDAARLARVVGLIEGFESPYGLELLATVHWVAHNEEATSLDAAVTAVHAWNESKRQRLSREHIALAWERLQAQGWLPEPPREVAAASPAPAKLAGKYDALDREALVRLLERRDAERQLGLVWERDELEADRADHRDYVALGLEPSLSHDDGPWPNLIIEGDNLDALRALRMSHAGRIRCIYIDPPYNTGNRDFVYNDRFVDKTHRFRHSLWLEFMHKRLVLARELLSPDGVIFVSIDDNEVFRLGMLMDQVFGNDHHVATCIWQKRYSRENRGAIGDAHEYVIAYGRDLDSFKDSRNLIPPTEQQAAIYKNPNNDPRGRWRVIPMTAQGFRPNQMYPIEGPDGSVHLPPEGRCWSMTEPSFKALLAGGRIYFGKSGKSQPGVIRFLTEVEGVVPWTWWPHDEVGHTDEARKEIQSIFGTQTAFDTPKPVRLIERVLRIATKPDDIVLDFFAGSGTTAHAVAKLNAEDGGNRRFILVSSTEATEDQPDKNLCRDVCAERVRRVLGGYTNAKGEAVPGLGGGFAYLKARRVAPHRLSTRLHHAEIWSALQLLHDLPLSHWDGQGLVAAADARSAVAYLPDIGDGSEGGVRAWHEAQAERARTLYSWTPDRVRAWAPGAQVSPIPESLRLRFGVRA